MITDYLEDALTPAETARLESHLRDCSVCDGVLAQFRETIRLAGRLREDQIRALDETVREPLLAAFREWAAGRGEARR